MSEPIGESIPEPRAEQYPAPTLRQAMPTDAAAIHALMRPFVAQRLLLDRTEAEIIELTRHGFVAITNNDGRPQRCVGFSAVEIYSPKLAELQCLAVHPDYQRAGVGGKLVQMCVDRARGLGVMEIMAISSSGHFLENCGFGYSLPDQKRALFLQLRPRHIK
ncbi:GNAT family N-acetyltransferase [Stieleria varia]|uniref:Amino-acid acetyltransferase n=1 Tax=Stieleria varia TaxID=2528005 RepID=A0A5C6A125_9BACT|nr:GNAT family N-acetyltransferase [Stieleria varia]TWT93279.1 Amino-acid acetyltransferase [Stieleria varia]